MALKSGAVGFSWLHTHESLNTHVVYGVTSDKYVLKMDVQSRILLPCAGSGMISFNSEGVRQNDGSDGGSYVQTSPSGSLSSG